MKPTKQKTKTNKWVEELDKNFGEYDTILGKCTVPAKLRDFFQDKITQTQQETLEWCEREIKKLKEKDKGWTGFGVLAVHMGNYEQIQASKDYGYNSAIEDLTKTIKQRKEGNQ